MNQTVSTARARRAGLPALLALALLAAACEARLDEHGYLPQPEDLQSIRPGATTREQVRELLGTPVAVGPFEHGAWYYASSSFENYMFFAPKLQERGLVVIRFGSNGAVSGIERLDEGDGRDIPLVERKTETRGRELGLMGQLLGNIGRFSGGAPPGP